MTSRTLNAGGRIVIALSGGVDSAVAAYLLVKEGYNVHAVFMENWRKTKLTPHCTVEEDRRDALRVANHLDIPYRAVNFEKEYGARVLNYFYREYEAGRTPNPDMMCNKEIKFRALLDAVHAMGIERLATGHYARTEVRGGHAHLLRGKDRTKDQSYFLASLNQDQLIRTVMPLGSLTKKKVRAIAKQAGIPVADKPDSQGICFVGKVNIMSLLRSRIPVHPGPIVDAKGIVLGEHQGLAFYTIGQRQGLGVAGGVPLYVAAKDARTNTLVVARGNSDPILLQRHLVATDPNWNAGKEPRLPLNCKAMIRYRQPAQRARVERSGGAGLRVTFALPQRAMTPGQAVVFYDGDECLGSAVIDHAEPARYAVTT